jgi:hypothetical protein
MSDNSQRRGEGADDHLEAPRTDARHSSESSESAQGTATMTDTVSIDFIRFDFP